MDGPLETSTLKLILYPLNIPLPNHPNPNHCHNRYHYDHHHHHCKKQSCPRWNWSGVRKRPLTSSHLARQYTFFGTRFSAFLSPSTFIFWDRRFSAFFGNIFHVRCPSYWELIVMLTIVNYFLILKEREKYHQRWRHCLHSIKSGNGDWMDTQDHEYLNTFGANKVSKKCCADPSNVARLYNSFMCHLWWNFLSEEWNFSCYPLHWLHSTGSHCVLCGPHRCWPSDMSLKSAGAKISTVAMRLSEILGRASYADLNALNKCLRPLQCTVASH